MTGKPAHFSQFSGNARAVFVGSNKKWNDFVTCQELLVNLLKIRGNVLCGMNKLNFHSCAKDAICEDAMKYEIKMC